MSEWHRNAYFQAFHVAKNSPNSSISSPSRIKFATGTRFPFNPENKIKILDIYNRIATINLISDNWIEYLQLIKLDGNWEIMNLIWQYRDIKMYKE